MSPGRRKPERPTEALVAVAILAGGAAVSRSLVFVPKVHRNVVARSLLAAYTEEEVGSPEPGKEPGGK